MNLPPLPATCPYVQRLLAAFKAQDSRDPLALILIAYGRECLAVRDAQVAAVVDAAREVSRSTHAWNASVAGIIGRDPASGIDLIALDKSLLPF